MRSIEHRIIQTRLRQLGIEDTLNDCEVYTCSSVEEFDNIIGRKCPSWAIATHLQGVILLKPLNEWSKSCGSLESIVLHEFGHFYTWKHNCAYSIWQDEALAMLLSQQYFLFKYYNIDLLNLKVLTYESDGLYAIVGKVVSELVDQLGESIAWDFLCNKKSMHLEQCSSLDELRSIL